MEKEIQERQPKWHAALKVIDVVCMACIIHVIGMVGVVDIVGIVGIVGVIRPCSASRLSRRGKHVHAHRPKRRTEATTPSVFSALKLLCWHGLHLVQKLSLVSVCKVASRLTPACIASLNRRAKGASAAPCRQHDMPRVKPVAGARPPATIAASYRKLSCAFPSSPDASYAKHASACSLTARVQAACTRRICCMQHNTTHGCAERRSRHRPPAPQATPAQQ